MAASRTGPHALSPASSAYLTVISLFPTSTYDSQPDDQHDTQGRKHERAWKQINDEHATALLAVEAKLAGKQREVSGLQDLNLRLFARFQDMRDQLARSQEKLSHEKLRGTKSFLV